MMKRLMPLWLAMLSAFLLSWPWVVGSEYVACVGFVPLLWMQFKKTKGLLWYAALAFFLWIEATCWWVAMATPLALVMVPLVGLCFTWVPFAIFVKLSKNVSESVKWILFITLWIAFEALYTYNDISFPWLTLGNAFEARAAQWFSITGVFGGSLLILIANVVAFKGIEKSYRDKQKFGKTKFGNRYELAFFAVVFVPVIVSMIMFYSYDEKNDPVQVAVIQPNIDPYTEKFGVMSNDQQIDIMLNLASGAPAETQFFVAPETAIDDQIWLSRFDFNNSIDTLRGFLSTHYPNATFVTGATTLRKVEQNEAFDYNTYKSGDLRFQVYNSALWIDTTKKVDIYHKSKLVCGVEMIPYPAVFKAIDDVLEVDLGGMGGKNGRSVEREVHKNVGTAICYEAIYSEFFTQYVKKGAQFMFVISNDGWWGDTPGHKHLLRYATHRAIENRRSIARSANTGISAIINQRGEVVDSLGWDERGAILATINANDKVTFYTKNGDFIVRIALYILALTLVYMVAIKFYKKNNPTK